MDRLWTPWRMEYIKRAGRMDDCIFCDLPADGDDETTLILARGEHAYVIMNKFPYNSGHLMVAPFRHTGDFRDLATAELAELTLWSQRCMSVLEETLNPHGFNLGVNQGHSAGAGVADHIHMHVVPRWGGDTNFMTTVGEVKVLPESLEATYRRLKPHFGA
jgi:ATP adenylyltransferase